MGQKEKLNRWKGLTVGLVGGLVGVYAMRYYWRNIAPEFFPEQTDWPQNPESDPTRAITLVGQHYEVGEPASAALGRRVFEVVTGHEPRAQETKRLLGNLAHYGWGLLAGALYGGTRTRTYPRDIAGGFFYGIRLSVGDALLASLMGLRAEPTAFSFQQHLWWLTGHWVYSFVTANVTRILYHLL